MRREKNNKKKPIEVYFILYLSALVLLISKPVVHNNTNTASQKNFDLPFALKAEKPMLTYRVFTDSFGNRHTEIDSINTIWDIGDVEDVHYEFVVEDQSLKHSIRLSNNSNKSHKYFKFIENSENRSVVFYWIPSLYEQENKTFIVYVSANGKLKNSPNNERIKAKTQFSLVIANEDVIYDVNSHNNIVYNKDSAIKNHNNNFALNNVYTINNAGELTLMPQQPNVRAVAQKEWTNKIIYSGFEPKDLKITSNNEPDKNGGSAVLDSYDKQFIIIKGKTPSSGLTKINLHILRKSDLKEASISFTVQPQTFEEPIYPKNMYSEQSYRLDPKLPLELDDAKAVLKEGNIVRVETQQGGKIEFTPNSSDIGKTLTFERYVNGNLFGRPINIKVLSYQNPKILRIAKKSNNVLWMEVATYGVYNGERNTIEKIDFKGDNATYTELHGKTTEDKNKFMWTEIFEIIPKNPNKPFKFRAIAIDRRGIKSEEENYGY